MAEQQGLEQARKGGFQMTPRAYRLFQSKLLTRIFEQMQASRSGRHQGPIVGAGAVELSQTKPYEFGDSVTHMDIPASFTNAAAAQRAGVTRAPEARRHRHPQDAQQPALRLGGAARHVRQHALRGAVHQRQAHGPGAGRPDPQRVPGDYLQFIEMYTFARPRHLSEIAELMPKPVTLYDPVVRLRADMSDPNISEMQIPPHFTTSSTGCSWRASSWRRRTRPTAR